MGVRIRNYFRRIYRIIIPYLYSKKNYKLFLFRGLVHMDKTTRAVMSAMDTFSSIMKPVPIKAPFGKSLLVVAPHQDDEIIGCGGAMILHKRSGKELNVLFVQDGGDEHKEDGLSRSDLISIRESEACRVAKELGISSPTFLRFKEIQHDNISEIAEAIKDNIRVTRADTIFAPFFLDYNIDHRMTVYALSESLKGLSHKPVIYGYEVWGLCIPNVILNIDSVIQKKKKLLSHYVSQISGTDYINCITGLNMYHSKAFGAGECKYAERYFETPGDTFVDIVDKIKEQEG